MKRVVFCLACLLCMQTALAWDGQDADTGENMEIESGNLVREGNDIEIYDYGSESYREVTVEDITDNGSSIDIEVYDHQSNRYRTFEMEPK